MYSSTSHQSPSLLLVPSILYSVFQLVHPPPTSVCLSARHPRVMLLSQPLGALLTPQHSVFAQSFGSRIQGWIVNYSRSACAPQPPALSALPRPAVDSSPWQWGRNLFSLMCPLPTLPPPPPSFSSSSLPCPMKRKLDGITWSGSVESASHWVEWCCHRSFSLLGKKALREMCVGKRVQSSQLTHRHTCTILQHCHTYTSMCIYAYTNIEASILYSWARHISGLKCATYYILQKLFRSSTCNYCASLGWNHSVCLFLQCNNKKKPKQIESVAYAL